MNTSPTPATLPHFTVGPCSTKGQSFLRWNNGEHDAPAITNSLQMPTEIAEHLARAGNEREHLLGLIQRMSTEARCLNRYLHNGERARFNPDLIREADSLPAFQGDGEGN